MSKDFWITILILITLSILITLLSGCVGKERALIDTCICDCKDQYFECYRNWHRDDMETKLDGLGAPIPK